MVSESGRPAPEDALSANFDSDTAPDIDSDEFADFDPDGAIDIASDVFTEFDPDEANGIFSGELAGTAPDGADDAAPYEFGEVAIGLPEFALDETASATTFGRGGA
jgi:hypothetical protein